jgi:acyl-CoA thioester hydrolase
MQQTLPPSSYPYTVTVPCRFTDIDASGTIGHVGLARYHEDARAAFIRTLIKSHGQDSSQWRALLCRISTDIMAHARYPEPICLAAGVLHVGQRSYGIEVAAFQNGRPLSRARSLGVRVDNDHGTLLLADEVRSILTAAQLPGAQWPLSGKPETRRQDLQSYPHRLQLATRFSDVDMMGHLNNVATLRYCEEGRVEMLGSLNRQRGTVIHTDIAYLREGRFMDDMIIATAERPADGGRFLLQQGLFQRQQCVATCDLIVTAATHE